jgi:hypothetical protein
MKLRERKGEPPKGGRVSFFRVNFEPGPIIRYHSAENQNHDRPYFCPTVGCRFHSLGASREAGPGPSNRGAHRTLLTYDEKISSW